MLLALVAIAAVVLAYIQLARRATQFKRIAAFHASDAQSWRDTESQALKNAARWRESVKYWSESAARTEVMLSKADARMGERMVQMIEMQKAGARTNEIRVGHWTQEAAVAGALAVYHERLVGKYRRAARFPFLSVPADPPEPKRVARLAPG
jgi:hypothetical protein